MNAPLQPSQLIADISDSFPHALLMSRERFAHLCGVSDGVVQGWIVRGYIPVYQIGKHRLINIPALNRMLLAGISWEV